MAAGVDTVASVAGIIAISLTIVKGCFEAFELIEKAQGLPSDAELVRWRLEYEHYRLHRWYKQVWPEDGKDPRKKLNWHLIRNLLKQFQVHLERSAQVRDRYNLMPGGLEDIKEASSTKKRAPTGIKKILSR